MHGDYRNGESYFIPMILVLLAITAFFIHFTATIKDEPAEEVIETKYTQKGLFIFPRYKVLVANSKQASTVTKEEFESISAGDTISGYKKNADTFVTNSDIQFEIALGIVILSFVYPFIFSVCGIILKNTKLIQNSQKYRNFYKRFTIINLYLFLIVYIIVGMFFTMMTATNIFNKMNIWNQTAAEAVVVDAEYNIVRGFRGKAYSTFEMFISYKDSEGIEHLTKKGVTKTTYFNYDPSASIPLAYRNNNIDDVFISTKSPYQIYPVFINIYFLFNLGFLVSLYFLIKKWSKLKLGISRVYNIDTQA